MQNSIYQYREKKAVSVITLSYLCIVLFFCFGISSCFSKKEAEEKESGPDLEYFSLRNALYGPVPENVKQSIEERFNKDKIMHPGISSLSWQFIGPSNTGGRIVDVEMPKKNANIIYAASASGGIFKSTDFGASWSPIFDNEITLSIGDIEIDPNNDKIIYAGTGEPNTGGGSITYDGNGIYKSVNAGSSWQQTGLTNVGTIAKVSVAKTNSNIIYVAAVGNIFQKSKGKGLYKSSDAGATWKKVLYISDSTSVNDVAISPADSNTVYATTWERIARPQGRVYGGITTNLYKSTNGGKTWAKLLADDASRGKMSIDIPPTNPNKLYISIANKDGSFNSVMKYDGATFTNISSGISGATSYTWWFGGIKCDPTNENIVYYLDFQIYKTTNGGGSWNVVAGSSHVDEHAIFVNPSNTSKIVIGDDGGVYTSTNNLSSLTHVHLPNSQVYDFDVYKVDETYISAGFQDNFFASSNNQSPDTWNAFGGGDGVEIRIDPTDKTQTYSSQYGGLNITTNGISSSDRFNWKCPIRLDPVNPKIIYFGTNKVYKFNPSANKWNAISGDLTNGSGSGGNVYGNLTTLAVAPSNNSYIYSGSDDGQVYVTKNGGTSWTKITAGLPVLWTSVIKVDPSNPEIAYAGFSGYRYGVKDAHIYKTTNAGNTWTRITNDMPQVPVNDFELDPYNANTFYLATDMGVYYSTNAGTNWLKLGTGMPNAVVSTLNYAKNSKQLYAATYGRSIYKIDVSGLSPVQNIAAAMALHQKNNNAELKIYPNPAKDVIRVTFPVNQNQGNINIYNSNGVKVIIKQTARNITAESIDISGLQPGAYLLEYLNGPKNQVQKFMVTR